jgi:drug/metabolite transporter (DMT)-like permease
MRFIKALSPRAVGISAAVVTVIIWTGFIIIARASADPARGATLTPFDIALARILGASAILLPWGWWLVQRDRARALECKTDATNRAGVWVAERSAQVKEETAKRSGDTKQNAQPPGLLVQHESSLLGLSPLSLKVTATVGLFGGLLYALLAYSGFVFAPAAHASVLMPGSLPLWTALLAVLFLKEHLTPARLAGLAFIVAGDLMVGGASLLRAFDGGTVWRGDVLFMTAALCWSTYGVLARHYALDAVRATIAITAFAFVIYVPVYLLLIAFDLVTSHFFTAPLNDVLFQAVFQGVGSVVISGITFTKMIQYFGPVRTTMFTAIVPGSSALGAAYFLGEPLSWNLWAGLGLVTCGILFGVRAVKPRVAPKIAATA